MEVIKSKNSLKLEQTKLAIIDIGSNSIRMLIYEDFSSSRVPFFNEKAVCELGKNLDISKNYIFAANHASSLDIPLMLGYLPFWTVPIAKIELKWIPFLGWAMQMAGHVFVDRGNHENAMLSIKNIKRSLTKKPRSILVFPEGSRTDDGKINQFKSPGSGDVLAGLVSAMVSQNISIEDACRIGVAVHGKAGSNFKDEIGEIGLKSTELIQNIRKIINL